MSYHELSQETANECSRAAFDYDPACYCEFLFVHGDYPPHGKYRYLPAKYLGLQVRRMQPTGEADRYVTSTWAETGPELLRKLRQAFADLQAGTVRDPSLPAPPPRLLPVGVPLLRAPGQGWIPTLPPTTQELKIWPL